MFMQLLFQAGNQGNHQNFDQIFHGEEANFKKRKEKINQNFSIKIQNLAAISTDLWLLIFQN